MSQVTKHPQTLQMLEFAEFKVDLRTRELRRNGDRVHLQDQPFSVLAVLLQHAGEVVTREQLREHLWSSDTFVDFDNSLNTSINKIREALGDSAENPYFVETLPRRGYRFIAPVENPGIGEVEARRSSVFPRTAKWTPNFPFTKSKRLTLLFSILSFLALAVVVKALLNLRSPLPSVIDSLQITNDGLLLAVSTLVSDGSRLYFTYHKIGPTEKSVLAQVSTQGGQT